LHACGHAWPENSSTSTPPGERRENRYQRRLGAARSLAQTIFIVTVQFENIAPEMETSPLVRRGGTVLRNAERVDDEMPAIPSLQPN
jgi:hypothetical protein